MPVLNAHSFGKECLSRFCSCQSSINSHSQCRALRQDKPCCRLLHFFVTKFVCVTALLLLSSMLQCWARPEQLTLQKQRSCQHISVVRSQATSSSSQRWRSCCAAASDGTSSSGSSSSGESPAPSDETAAVRGGEGVFGWLKRSLGSSKLDKQKLAEYGLGAFAAYGIISNINAGVLVTIAWLTVVKQTGLTPLDPGQWPRFLAVYAGLYLTTNLLRPLRLTLALTVAPFFNKGLEGIQRVLRCNRAVAFGIMLACIAVSSFICIGSAIVACGGFPNGLPPLPGVPWTR